MVIPTRLMRKAQRGSVPVQGHTAVKKQTRNGQVKLFLLPLAAFLTALLLFVTSPAIPSFCSQSPLP